MPVVAPEDRVTQSDAELHVGLEVPRHSAKQIHNWVRQQEWPEGTELEHPSDYHVTLLYTPEGHREHKDSWWMSHMDQTPVKLDKFESFPLGPDGHPYVLRISSPEIEEHANMLQNRAEAMGLPITKFPGGYKPHLTVGYGPQEVTGLTVPNFEFDIGPSSVSPIRPKKEAKLAGPPKKPPGLKLATKESERCGTCEMFWKGRCWGYDRYEVQQGEVCKSWAPDKHQSSFAEPISIEHIARRMQNEDIPSIVLMLKAAGWTPSELNVQTTLQTYYELQSDREIFDHFSGDLSQRLSAFTEPWEPGYPGKGMLSPMGSPILWKTDAPANNLVVGYPHHGDVMTHLQYPAGSEYQNAFYIHPDGRVEDVNDDIEEKANFARAHPALRPVANPEPFNIDPFGYTFGHTTAQTRCLNCSSVLDDDGRCPNCSTVPSQVNDPEDHWPEYGERPPDRKHDVQFSNDWGLKGVT